MCGIVALISKKIYGIYQKDIEIFEQMLYADALRGEDSTGVITVELDGSFHIDKEGTNATAFLYNYDKCASRKQALQKACALIGHNRKGTVGKISDETAHPFVVKDTFAMVHNGTLWNHNNLAKTDVDSEALSIVIQKALSVEYSGDPDGKAAFLKKEIEDTLSDVHGAYAVVWYNQETNQIQFIRNDQRPLWVLETDDHYLLSSEAGLAQWILGRNSIKPKTVEYTKEDTLYSICLDSGKVALTSEALNLKKATPPTTTANSMGGHTGATITNNSNTSTLSKQECKRIKKNLLNRTLTFFAVDYVEKHLYAGFKFTSDYLLIGESTDIDSIPHVVKGEINLKKLKIYDEAGIEDVFFKGTVTNVTYDMKAKQAEIQVSDIETMVSSISALGNNCEENTTACM